MRDLRVGGCLGACLFISAVLLSSRWLIFSNLIAGLPRLRAQVFHIGWWLNKIPRWVEKLSQSTCDMQISWGTPCCLLYQCYFIQTQKGETVADILTCKRIQIFVAQGRTWSQPAEFQQEKFSLHWSLNLLCLLFSTVSIALLHSIMAACIAPHYRGCFLKSYTKGSYSYLVLFLSKGHICQVGIYVWKTCDKTKLKY